MALPRLYRLRASSDIQKVLRRGKRTSGLAADVFRLPRADKGDSRFALVISRRVAKKSSSRNTVRRRASEWIRQHAAEFLAGFDIVIFFKPAALNFTRRTFYKELRNIFARAALV